MNDMSSAEPEAPRTMELDREFQLQVLHYLVGCQPDGVREIPELPGATGEEGRRKLLSTLRYLADHELIVNGYSIGEDYGGDTYWVAKARTRITAKGLDFLADDGGLGAILGVVTIRVDAAQWAEHLASRVEQLKTATPHERSELAKAIRKLPAKAIEKLSGKMLDWAVDHAEDALPLLHRLIAQVAG
jgi:hypothetical protein